MKRIASIAHEWIATAILGAGYLIASVGVVVMATAFWIFSGNVVNKAKSAKRD